MRASFGRTLTFTWLTVREYGRSGRIAVEAIAVGAIVWALFWPWNSCSLDGTEYFTLGGLFILALTMYTTFSIVNGLGNRAQGYIVLSHKLSRRGYLLGLYLASLVVLGTTWLALSFVIRLLNWPCNLTLGGYVRGTVPLMIDVAIMAAFVTLITPLVMSGTFRLLLLALLALAINSDFRVVAGLDLGPILTPVQSVLSIPLLPAGQGYVLALDHGYGWSGLIVLAGQLVMLTILLAIALFRFERQDVVFNR